MTDTPTDGGGEGTWAKLRRRKVVQWGFTYAAGAWGFLQGLEYASEAFHWPEQLRQVAILALLIGLPIVLVVAWYHGDRGEQRVLGTELSIITLLFVLGGAIFWRYDHLSRVSTATTTSAVAQVPAPTIDDARPSIAVLPFENRSHLEDDAFFVDGIHDDILMQLTKVSALKVTSRTSVEQFRDTRLPLRSIAGQLGVTTILEGGVQRAGGRVRINVQLIDAATDAHLWAESYDRDLTAENIFAVQSEVAVAIAEALKATLTPAERTRVTAVPTRSLEAWEAYQLGKQRMAKRTAPALAEAERFFRAAIERDGKFALAYAGLADAIWLHADHGGQPWVPAIAEAEEILGQALKLDPNLPEALATMAKFAQERRDFTRAEAGYRRAIELNPNYAMAHNWYAQLLGLQGRDTEALQSMRRAVELDPLSAHLQVNLAWGLAGQGRFDEALAAFKKVRDIDPLSPLPYGSMGAVHVTAFGRLGDAIPFFEQAIELDATGSRYAVRLAQVYVDLGDEGQAEHWLDRATEDGVENAVRALLHLYRGVPSEALACARQALDIDPRDQRSLALLRDADLQANDAAAARSRYARAFPELLEEQPPVVDPSNYGAAVDVALVLQKTGESKRAAQLLDRSDELIRVTSRMGPWGYGIADVQIHALRGRQREALAALREAEQAGWRGPAWRYARDFDPTLALIRDEPQFKSVFADIERDMARQRAEFAARPKDAPLDLAQVR